jgi:LacI family transcriptional regulator
MLAAVSSERPVRRPPRLRDVAEVAGVDPSLVSRILSGDTRVSVRDETRSRIVEAAAALGYRPNPHARALKLQRSMAIGMVLPTLTNAVYAAIHRGAEERAAELGYVILLATGSVADRVAALHGRIDGVLLAIATSERVPVDDGGATLPTVLVNRAEPGSAPSVTVDDEAGARLATEHLLDLGHRSVGHVAGPLVADTARRRLAGYRAALRARGLPADPGLLVEGGYAEDEGFRAAADLLARPRRPPALFVANIQAAIGVLAAIRRSGLSVPADVSVASLHDSPLALYLDPPLTTVRMPLGAMGRQAVDALVGEIEGQPAAPRRIDDPPVLLRRASTAPPPAA